MRGVPHLHPVLEFGDGKFFDAIGAHNHWGATNDSIKADIVSHVCIGHAPGRMAV